MLTQAVKWLLPVAAMLMLAFGYVHVFSSQPNEEKLSPPAQPARSSFNHNVAAAGMVEARSENIAIGSAIAGVVLDVYVPASKVGTQVKKGQPLFRVDDRNLRAQLRYQEAFLANAISQFAKLDAMPRPEEVPPQEAKVQSAEANMRMAKDQADRAKKLVAREAISSEEYIQREMTHEMAKYQFEQAKAELALLKAGSWRPDKEISRSSIELAKAQIEQTRTEIERATVCSPIDGHVLQVTVRPGEYVGTQPGQSLMLIGDLSRYHVRVDVDEHDIPRFQPGARARAQVRGHASREISLSFVRVENYVTPKKSLTGDNTERVDTRVLQVIYAVEPTSHTVYVGQQLDVFIEASADSAP